MQSLKICNHDILQIGVLRDFSVSYLHRAKRVDTHLIFAKSASQNGIPADQFDLSALKINKSRRREAVKSPSVTSRNELACVQQIALLI